MDFSKYSQSNQYNTPPQPWTEIWIKALTQPSLETYEEILKDPNVTMNRALMWIGSVVGIAFGFTAILLLCSPSAGSSALMLLACLPVMVGLALAGYVITIGIFYISATAFGGEGSFDEHIFSHAAFYAPLLLVSIVLNVLPRDLAQCINIPLNLYIFILSVIAVKATHKFGWGQAVLSLLAPGIVVVIAAFCILSVANTEMGVITF